MKTTQEILLRDSGAIVEGTFASIVAVEVSAIALYSVSTTVLVVLLLFYRGPVVVTGVLLGGLAILISPSYFVIVLFGLTGFLPVFLTFKIDKKYLNYKKSIIESLKAGFVLFLTHAVIKVPFAFFDIMQNLQRGSEGVTAVLGGGPAFGVYSRVQLLFLAFLTTGGGLLAHKVLEHQNALPDQNT